MCNYVYTGTERKRDVYNLPKQPFKTAHYHPSLYRHRYEATQVANAARAPTDCSQ